jgi:hypothetical protein
VFGAEKVQEELAGDDRKAFSDLLFIYLNQK